MKKKLTFITALLSFISLTAQDFIVDNIGYNIVDSQTVKIAPIGTRECPKGHVTIPDIVSYNAIDYRVTEIGVDAFAGCSSLTSISIPNSVTHINDLAFARCSGLTNISIPNSVTRIGGSAFWKCHNLKTIDIPDTVTDIGNFAFLECFELEEIDLPNSLEFIASGIFFDCKKLKSIDIPNSVTAIWEVAFENCKSLETVNIPSSVTSIGQGAFSQCIGLETISIDIKTPLAINEDVFEKVYLSAVTLKVPENSVNAYNTAPVWKRFMINGGVRSNNVVTTKLLQNELNVIENTAGTIKGFSVFNLQGELLKTSIDKSVDMSDLDANIYVVKINTDAGVITKKIVKQ